MRRANEGRADNENRKESLKMRIQRTTAYRLRIAPLVAVAALAATGCDLEVTNPGPVQDEFLNDEQAFPSVLQGVRRANALAYTRLAYDSGLTSFEGTPGGLVDSEFYNGKLTSENVDDHWERAQQARWMAEDGVRRRAAAPGRAICSPQIAGRLLGQAGFAQRTLGHNMCIAVFDGGPEQPYTDFLTRAEEFFTQAIGVGNASGASDIALAAQAGRADVRMWLGDWSGARSDATGIPEDFVFQLHHYDLDDFPDPNEVYFRGASDPWREYTIWGTFAESYYTETGDPRMGWYEIADAVTMVYNLPFYVQLKFTSKTAPHTLASGREMILIQAEEILANNPGNFQAAMDLINQVRTSVVSDHTGEALPPATASNATEAWTALKQERRVELWFDNRRFADLRRWGLQSSPGATPMEDMSGRSNCFPVGVSEIDTNSNPLNRVS
ncbi:MAG: RagB/SusD family nutrient uptake outer membrane protein [Gammaproteobacteria bacterium]|nr:RagB/SusD family nutrient uptake outer membrane protein [Gammaproteobacteria bacterium]